MKRLSLAAVLACALLAGPAAASADDIVARTGNQFSPSTVTIDQGQRVTFRNDDLTTSHNVASDGRAPDGSRLFSAPVTDAGGQSTVKGTEYLTTGTYSFVCQLHPGMAGTLQVTANGTPLVRPDTLAPSLSLRELDSRLSRVRRHRALKVRVKTNEAGTVRLTARARGKKLGTARTTFAGAGSRTVKLSLTRAGRRALRGLRTVKVRISGKATDAAGNIRAASIRKTLRR